MKVRAWNEDFTAPVDYVLPPDSPHLTDSFDDINVRIQNWNMSQCEHRKRMKLERGALLVVCKRHRVPMDVFRLISREYLERPVPFVADDDAPFVWSHCSWQLRFWIILFVGIILIYLGWCLRFMLTASAKDTVTHPISYECPVSPGPHGPPGPPGPPGVKYPIE
jgi:hypothetical protein